MCYNMDMAHTTTTSKGYFVSVREFDTTFEDTDGTLVESVRVHSFEEANRTYSELEAELNDLYFSGQLAEDDRYEIFVVSI